MGLMEYVLSDDLLAAWLDFIRDTGYEFIRHDEGEIRIDAQNATATFWLTANDLPNSLRMTPDTSRRSDPDKWFSRSLTYSLLASGAAMFPTGLAVGRLPEKASSVWTCPSCVRFDLPVLECNTIVTDALAPAEPRQIGGPTLFAGDGLTVLAGHAAGVDGIILTFAAVWTERDGGQVSTLFSGSRGWSRFSPKTACVTDLS